MIINDSVIKSLMEKLEGNNMKPYFCKTAFEAKELVMSLIPQGAVVTNGGSVTMKEIGVMDEVKERADITYLDRAKEGLTPEEVKEIYKKAFFADVYLMSSNALTLNGELYNVDGNGNRVAAMIYGPKQVIIVAGINKIVTDLHAAVDRLETIASPANCIRLNKKTPCAMTGRCGHCNSNDRICNDYVIMAHQREKDRIKVIFIADEFGY